MARRLSKRPLSDQLLDEQKAKHQAARHMFRNMLTAGDSMSWVQRATTNGRSDGGDAKRHGINFRCFEDSSS